MLYTYVSAFMAAGMATPYVLQDETYPLDVLAGFSAAWSSRKLASAYTGDAFDARRLSDDVTIGIPFDGYVLDNGILAPHAGGNAVSLPTIHDQTGNARNLVQAVALTQPHLLGAGGIPFLDLGGYPAFDFATTQQCETVANASTLFSTTAGTIFAVVLVDTTTGTAVPNGRGVWGQSGGNAGLVFQNGVKAAAFTFGGGGYQSATATGLAVSTAYVIVWRHSGGNLDIFVNNGTAIATVASGTSDSIASPFRVGAIGGSSPLDGRLAEVLVHPSGLSDGDVSLVAEACATPYGVVWT